MPSSTSRNRAIRSSTGFSPSRRQHEPSSVFGYHAIVTGSALVLLLIVAAAWGYGKGHSESILGRVVREYPGQQLIVATKLPPKNFTWPSRRGC